MDMKKYYSEKQKLVSFANKVLKEMKQEDVGTVNLSKLRYKYEDQFSCSWRAFTNRVLLVVECEPDFVFDKKNNLLTYTGEYIKPEPIPEPVPIPESKPVPIPEPIPEPELTPQEKENLEYERKRQEFYKNQEKKYGKITL